MSFHALEVSIEVVHSLRGPLERIRSRDRGLYEPMRASASSVVLNLAEGSRRVGRDRLHLWRVAAGSAEELRVSLRVAMAWGDVDGPSIEPALALIDRVLAMIWRLVHPTR